jgi:hypothetical protein
MQALVAFHMTGTVTTLTFEAVAFGTHRCQPLAIQFRCLCNHAQRRVSTVTIHEMCQETIRHEMQALWFLHSSYFTMLIDSVQYGRLLHPSHSAIDLGRVPHWPTITQTKHKDWVAIQVCLLVDGAMATMFLIGKTWNSQLIPPGPRVQIHILLA